jgi:hypothetical protein
MYSRFVKYIISISSFFPIFLVFWLVNLLGSWKELHFYFNTGSAADFFEGLKVFLKQHGLLLIFLALLILCRQVIRFAQTHLSPQAIDIKAIKPANVNFVSAILSYVGPFFKFFLESGHDYIYAGGYFLMAAVIAMVTSRAYHYNMTFSIFFRYQHFEVSTTKDVTYLILSRKHLVNKKQLTEVVHLTDYMLIEPLVN